MFEEIGAEVIKASEDADIIIVNTAINKSAEYKAVKIVGEDTDLLVLLTQYCGNISNVYLEKRVKKKQSKTVYKTVYSPENFSYPKLKKIIAFLHAFAGCDTTSAFYLKGKEKIFKVMNANGN